MPDRTRAKRVFISHSGSDTELARDIARRLRESGLEPVVFAEARRSSAPSQKRLVSAIRNADAMILLVTPAALDSPWPAYELGIALATDKAVLSVTAGIGDQPLSPVLANTPAVPYDRLDSGIQKLSKQLANGSAAKAG